jgi:hypothetical protein
MREKLAEILKNRLQLSSLLYCPLASDPYYSLAPFGDAIPVVASTHLSVDFTSGQIEQNIDGRPEGVRRSQSVNISQATVERFAREKLREALQAKLGYNKIGLLGSEETVGQNISARA